MPAEVASLFAPLELGNITLPNRIVVSPMCQYSSEDGFANDWHLVHLGSRAAGGASMSPPWVGERLVTQEEGGWDEVVAPSPIPFAPHYKQPKELDDAGIDRIV